MDLMDSMSWIVNIVTLDGFENISESPWKLEQDLLTPACRKSSEEQGIRAELACWVSLRLWF